ncbi:unnamed protein product [Ectocarpus sp. 13 AM-2016]
MSNTKKMTAMSSMEAFFNDLTGASKEEQEEKEEEGEKRDVPHEGPANDSLTLTSSSSSPTFRLSSSRRRSWDRGRMAITSSFRTLMSPNLDGQDGQDADVGDVTPRRRPGSRREDGRRGGATPDRGNLPAESGKPAAAAAAEGASAAGPRSARSKRLPSPRVLPWPSPGPARISGNAPLPSPGSPLPRRRSLSMNSAVSDSSQLSDHQQQWAEASRAKATAEGPADGLTAAVLPHVGRRRSGGGGGGSSETGGVSPSSTHRGNVGSLLRSNSERDEGGNCLRKGSKVITNQDRGGGRQTLTLP